MRLTRGSGSWFRLFPGRGTNCVEKVQVAVDGVPQFVFGVAAAVRTDYLTSRQAIDDLVGDADD